MRRFALAVCLCLLGAGTAHADFDITDFSTTTVNFTYPVAPLLPNGLDRPNLASVIGTALNVTPAVTATLGCVWVDTQESVTAGFTTEFTFEFLNSGTGGGGGSGDGLAFVIQNDPQGLAAIGNHASGMGYGGFPTDPTRGINNSLALEIDDFFGVNQDDPDGNHISLHTRFADDNSAIHSLASIAETSAIPFFGQGSGIHTVRIEYDGTTMNVFFDNLVTPALSVVVDLFAITGSPTAWVGITGSGGSAYQIENVYSWSFVSGPPTPVELCANGVDDDADGDIDCLDADCATDPACVVVEICNNLVDDDADGDIDCLDSDCVGDPSCPVENCTNMIDDDGDGDVDCLDADCATDPACVGGGDNLFRGDTNNDGGVNIADAIYLLGNLFPGANPPNVLVCLDACDTNDDGGINIADAIALLGSLFGSPAVPLAFPNSTDGCNEDPTPTLGCDTFTACGTAP